MIPAAAFLLGAAWAALCVLAVALAGDPREARRRYAARQSDPLSLDRQSRRFDDEMWIGEWPPYVPCTDLPENERCVRDQGPFTHVHQLSTKFQIGPNWWDSLTPIATANDNPSEVH